MEYQKIIKLLGNTPNHLSKFRTKYWIDAAARQADEINKGVIFKNYAPFINCKSENK